MAGGLAGRRRRPPRRLAARFRITSSGRPPQFHLPPAANRRTQPPLTLAQVPRRSYRRAACAAGARPLLSHAAGENILVELDIAGKSHLALVQEVQHAPVGGAVLHIDFHAVSQDEVIQADVPLEPVGTANGVKNMGGLLEQNLRSLAIECLPRDLPDVIRLHAQSLAHVYIDRHRQSILVVGGTLIAVLPQRALAGIIAHELSHFTAGDARRLRNAQNWHEVMVNLEVRFLIHNWAIWNPLVWLIRLYHLIYFRLFFASQRCEEFLADSYYVDQVGEENAATTLVLISVLDNLPWTNLPRTNPARLDRSARAGCALDRD